MATENALSRAGFEGPVLKAENDCYGYTAIAEGLARSISALDENVSTVIGIEGQWGSGKTSLLNLLTEQLKSQVPANTQIVVFSPWINSPDESPVNALMMTIAARLAKLDKSAMAQAGQAVPLAENILNYAQQTSRRLAPVTRFAGNFVPGLGLVADGMEKLVRFGNLHGNQIVQGAYEKVMHNGTERCHLAAQDRVYAGKDTRDYLYSTLRVDLGTGTAWGKIFLRAFLNDERVCFDETLFIEDTMFMFDAVRYSRSVGFVDAICYRYDRNAQSLVTAYKPDYSKKISTYLDYFSCVIRDAHDHSLSTLFDEYVAFYLLLLMLHYVFNTMNTANETERRHQFRQLLEDPMYSKALRNISLHAFTWSKRLSIIALRMKSYTMMRVICGLRHRQLGDC